MTDPSPGRVEAPIETERIIGRVRGRDAGPTVIALGGIHGNEPSGVHAARRVIGRLQTDPPPLRGELIALAGNREALGRNIRHIDRDLNRNWTAERVELLSRTPAADASLSEDREQRELLAVLDEAKRSARGEIFFLDLHTSSAVGPPFVTIGDTLRHWDLALRIPVTVILGLEEQVDGALLEYMNEQGHVTLGVEGGRHDLETSIDNHEAILWLALVAAGLLRPEDVPDLTRHRRTLMEASRGVPAVIEVRHHHRVRPGDSFRMESGFRNLQPVTKGEILARDRSGVIRAVESGLVLLPLYQGKGDDGFFLCRPVRMFWLRLSALLRRLRAGALVHLLPGIRRHPEEPKTLLVSTRIARLYPLELFHLLGYRKRRRIGPTLVVSRRRHDI